MRTCDREEPPSKSWRLKINKVMRQTYIASIHYDNNPYRCIFLLVCYGCGSENGSSEMPPFLCNGCSILYGLSPGKHVLDKYPGTE